MRALVAALLLAVPLAACAAAPARAPRPPDRAMLTRPAEPYTPRALSAQAAPFDGAMVADGTATVLSVIAVRANHPLWGGLSGLSLDPDGERFVTASDRGALFEGRLVRRDGALAEVADLRTAPFPGPDGAQRPPGVDDVEALTRTPDGALLAAFEQHHRVWRWAEPGAPAEILPRHPAWDALPQNTGLEALASDVAGTLVAIAEHPGAPGGFPLFRLDPGEDQWRQGVWPGDGVFRPTGASFGPDGRLYVLERAFSFLAGFRMRLRRASLDGVVVRDVETLITLRGAGVDNFEGVGVWGDAAGALRAVVVSDDNFFPLQRTLFMEIALPP